MAMQVLPEILLDFRGKAPDVSLVIRLENSTSSDPEPDYLSTRLEM
jgi:hypothetical protein